MRHLPSTILLLSLLWLTACSSPRPDDPRLEWAYATGSQLPQEATKAGALPNVELKADHAQLGAIIREVAKQSGITVIYPDSYESAEISGDFHGPGDAVLDALARLHDYRFQVNAGVGLIGKPLAGDRAVAIMRPTFPNADKILQPLLSETGKVALAGGLALLTDRAEVLQRVVHAAEQVQPRLYAFQLLEVYTNNGLTGSLALHVTGTTNPPPLSHVFDAQIDAALTYADAYLGRTWTSVISEGQLYQSFLGSSEQRNTSIVTQNSFISSTVNVVQTGWHFDVQVFDGRALGTIYQDATGDTQYRIEFAAPAPGLYLVHSSDISSRNTQLGFPSSSYAGQHLKRYIWVRYLPLGQLQQLPPAPLSHDPIVPPPPTRPLLVPPKRTDPPAEGPRPIGPAPTAGGSAAPIIR